MTVFEKLQNWLSGNDVKAETEDMRRLLAEHRNAVNDLVNTSKQATAASQQHAEEAKRLTEAMQALAHHTKAAAGQ